MGYLTHSPVEREKSRSPRQMAQTHYFIATCPTLAKATLGQVHDMLCLELADLPLWGQVVRWEGQFPLALSSTCCVTPGMSLSRSEPQFLFCIMETVLPTFQDHGVD